MITIPKKYFTLYFKVDIYIISSLPSLIRFKGHPPYHTKTIQNEIILCTLSIMT